ncbi:Gfo/Idh/MocA family protein [Streptomyces arboris]|uniref:Gfo/Idh/MocA family protein n=1 Tax=Streptomyces arboris TaxID=2600619 RepID=UPI003C2B6AE2
MGPRLRVGVLGCASIARRKMLPALASNPSVRLVAVASRTGEKAARFAAPYGCDAVTGYEELLRRTDVDAVYIPLPAALRATWIARALEAGKHVLGEKPLTTTAADARDLVALGGRRGLLLMESFMFLHHSVHRRVTELVAAGRIGEPRSFTAEFTIPPLPADDIRNRPGLGGGALLDLGVYTVRAAQYFCGPGLSVAGAVLMSDPPGAGAPPATGPYGGVDRAGAALLASDRTTAQLTFGMAHAYQCRYRICGSEGRLSLDRAFTPPPDLRPVVRIEDKDGTEERTLEADDHFANTVTAFAGTALGGGDLTGHGEQILRQADLVERIRRAAAPAPRAA